MAKHLLAILSTLLLVPGVLPAQTLQLPTFNSFATSTSVLVPDRGYVSLGSIQRGSAGRSQFGGPLGIGGGAFGAGAQAGGVSAGVVIHDFEASDELLLKTAAARRLAQGGGIKASTGRLNVETSAVRSVAEIEADRPDASQAAQREVDDYLARAKAASQVGKPGVARVYYQMAARRATGPLRTEILSQAAALATASPPKNATR